MYLKIEKNKKLLSIVVADKKTPSKTKRVIVVKWKKNIKLKLSI